MKKSIFLFFAAILCAIGASAAVVTPTGKYFYFKTNSDWKVDGARFAVCFQWKNGGGQDDSWHSCVNVEGDVYYVVAPAEYWDMYFCRMNGSTSVNSWTNKWNQSTKLQYDGTNNYFQKNAGWNEDVTYNSNYAPPMSSVTLADNGTTVNSGTGTQADPYIIEIGTKIKVQASGTKAVDDPDAVINYAFKYGATSQDSETTTWEIAANSPSTTYAIELEGYTKVNTTASTKKAATKLYYQTVADATLPTYQVTVTANDPAMGTVTGTGEYSEGATAELTATPNAGYKFVKWTVDETEKSTETTYSFTVTEDVEVVANFQAIPKETVYFVNAEDWTGTIYAYAFADGGSTKNAAWPGEVATKEANQIGGHDVYSFTAEKGKYETVIFNNNEGKQTSDMTWTAGQYICKNEWCADEAAVLAKLNGPVEYESVYFVNVNGWAAVNIYTWSPNVASWPGVAMTKEAEQLGGYDVYSYTVEKGTTFGGMKFNEGEDKQQTGDLTWTAGKYYVIDNWYTKAEAEAKLATLVKYDYYIAGNMNGWNKASADYGMTDEDADGIYEKEITLAAGQDHQFKVTNGKWGNEAGGFDCAAVEGAYEEVDSKDGNVLVKLDAETTFTVKFDKNAKKISFEGLTQIHTVKATINPAEAGTIKGLAADGKYNHGAEATLTAAPAEGYEFVNWTVGGKEVSAKNPYTFTVTADVALVANFVAVDYKDITFTVGKSGFTGVPQIKWWGAKGLEDAAEPVEMTAGQYSRYSYTFSNIDAITGVSFYIVLDGVQSKTITLHETPNTYSQFYTILQEVFVTLDGETEGVQLEGHPMAGFSRDYTKVNGVVQLPANTTKAFKLTVDGKDKGGNTIALTKDNLTANFTEDGEGNATIATELAGGYLFTYDYITKDVTVVYPFVGTMDLGQMTPSYSDESVTLKDDNNNEVTIYNVVEGEHTFGDNFDIEASVMHNGEWYTLTGKGSWTLADGVMTLVTTNLVDENNTVNYTITATALAPQEYTIACNGTYDEEVSAYYSSIKYAATTDEEDVIVIEIGVYGEETSASGQFNDNLFTTLTYTVEEGEDGVKVLTATATDEAGNTYHITITATKLVYPTVNIYGATATLDEEGTLTLSAEYKGKTVISEIWGYEGAGEYVWVGLVSTDYSFEWSANVVTVTEENGQYTITGVFLDDTDETKYNVTITTKATATALDNLNTTVAPVKMIENGQLIIVKDGVQYNAQGAVVK